MTALSRQVVSKITSASLLLGLLVAIPLGILTALPANAVSCASGMSVQANLKAVPAHGNVFYIDSGVTPKVDAAYAGYKITNSSGSTMSGLWVSIEGFTGGNLGLTNPLDQYQQMDDITAGSYKTAYYLLKATGPTTTAQTHTIKVYNKRPDLVGATLQLTCTFTFSAIKETIKANANKVNTITGTLLPTTATLGGKLTVAVTSAATGKVGAGSTPDGSIIWVSPSGVSTWPTRALRLESTTITLVCGGSNPDIVLVDSLIQTTANTSCYSSANGSWTASYIFRIIGTGPSALKPSPIAQISSGTQYKHSDITSLTFSNLTGGTVDLSGVAASSFSVTVAASSTLITGGTTSTNARVEYTVTLTTTSTQAVQVDEVVDVPASGTTYVTGSSKVNGTTVADPIALASESSLSPPPLHYIGPYSVVSGTPVVIKFQRDIPCTSTPTDYKSTTYAKTGDQLLGKTTTQISGLNVTTTSGASCTAVVTDNPQTISPTAQTNPATSISSSGATLNGYANAYNSASVTAVFEYSTDINLVNSLTTTSSQNVTGSTTSILTAVTGTLSANTLYYFRIKVSSPTTTTAYGVILSFKSSAIQAVPTVITSAASSVGSTTATLNGSINPNLTDISQVKFFIGTSSADVTSETGSASAKIVQSLNDAGTGYLDLTLTGSGSTQVSFDVTSLSGSTVYYFKLQGVCTVNATYCPAGKVNGTVLQFKTGAPQVTTTDATLVTDVTATLNGSMSSSVANVKYQFYYCLSSGSCSISSLSGGSTVGTSAAVANPFNSAVSHNLTGLTGNRTYFYQIQGLVSDVAVSFGEIKTFTTLEISTASLASGSVGTSYSVGLLGAGGVGPYTWTADTLSAGLVLSTNGVISGTPTTAGTTSVTISMKDEFYGTTITKSYSLVIAATYVITYDATTNGGTAISPLTVSFISGGTALTLPTPASRTGYTFNGWFTASTAGTDLGKTTYTPDQTRTIYAQWSGNNYAITYAAGTSASGTIAQQTFTYPSSITLSDTTTATSFTRSGYQVVGWATSDGGSKAYDLGVNYAEALSRTLYPVWSGNTYTITYSAGTGGSGSTASQSFLYPGSVTLKSAAQASGITKTGYTITGWTTSDGGLSATNALSSSYSSAANLVLYPVWTADVYTITYDATTNGGTAISPLTVNYTYGTTALTLPTPVARTGYTFNGWFIASSGGSALSSPYTPTQTRTLYAQWSANTYTITYNAGTGASGTTTGQSFVYPASVTLKSAADASGITRTGYSITGWSTSNLGAKTNNLSSNYSTAANLDLYPVWTANSYTITYNAGTGGSGSITSQTYNYPGPITLSSSTTSITKAGYSLVGWATSDGGSKAYDLGESYAEAQSRDLYPVWSIISYTVTYYLNTGSGTVPTQVNRTIGQTFTVASDTGLTGPIVSSVTYLFSSWNTQSDGNGFDYHPSDTFTVGASNVTLYANWISPSSKTITFVSNDHALESDDSVVTQSSSVSVANTRANTFTRAGYTFTGWRVTRDNSGTPYANEFTYDFSANLKVYAQWSANSYTITYNAGTNGSGSITSQSFTFPGPINLSSSTTAITRSGYTISGWAITSGGGQAYNLGVSYAEAQSRTLYPVWTANNYTITYNTGTNGSGSISSQPFTYPGPVLLADTSTATTITRSGYSIAGWTITDGGAKTYDLGVSYGEAQSRTLYPVWSANSYTITYNAGINGSGSITSQSFTFPGPINLSSSTSAITRSGYTASGWTLTDGGAKAYDLGVSYADAQSRTLYPAWTANGYTITYNAGANGSGSVASQTFTYPGLISLADTSTATTITRSGYSIAGWAITDGGAKAYDLGVSYAEAQSRTLFPVWTANNYTITYNAGANGSGSISS